MTKPKLEQGADYERGFVDGAQHQMQSSVDRAVNAMTQPTYYIPSKDQRTWVGLTDEEVNDLYMEGMGIHATIEATEAKLKDKNNAALPEQGDKNDA